MYIKEGKVQSSKVFLFVFFLKKTQQNPTTFQLILIHYIWLFIKISHMA